MATELNADGTPVETSNTSTETNTESNTTEPSTTETPVTEQGAEGETSTEQGAEGADGEAKEAGPSSQELWDAFVASTEAAIAHEGRDEASGSLPEAAIAPVKVAYAALNPTYKARAKELIQNKLTAYMTGDDPSIQQDYSLAKSWLDLFNNLKAAPAKATQERVVKAPVDPTPAFVDTVLAHMFSSNFLTAPEGVTDDWRKQVSDKAASIQGQVATYRDWLAANAGKDEADRTPEPEVDAAVKAAARLGSGARTAATVARVRKPRAASTSAPAGDGVRRDIGKHIDEAFANVASGTFLTIGDIVNFKSSEYGDVKPSQGAIAARLFPKSGKCTIEGVRPEGPEQGHDKKGAVKL